MAYNNYIYRRTPVPYTGNKRLNLASTGIKSGQYAREIKSVKNNPFTRASSVVKYNLDINPWGPWDTKYRAHYRQPRRDWKRTKVARQYLLHQSKIRTDIGLVNRLYNNDFPFNPLSLGMELYLRTPKRIGHINQLHSYRMRPSDESIFEAKEAKYIFKRDDGDYEYECPECGYLNMTDLSHSEVHEHHETCRYCRTFVYF